MAYLTKSMFKLALECPTKLYYTSNNYANSNKHDTFLEALAEGGFQVGELAKYYFPGGHDITEKHYEEPLKRTNELIKQENVIIYEAAIKYKNLFIRVDVLKKTGNNVQLIEVKAKSTDGDSYTDFLNKKGDIATSWKPYVYDVAFQKYVMKNAYPKWNISGYLMLADEKAVSTASGLNQRFQLRKTDKGRTYEDVKGDVTLVAWGRQGV